LIPVSETLNRRIGPVLLTFYGLGVMVGAGIYVLVGAVAGQAGDLAWLAFLVAGLVAAPSAMSFAELSSRLPEAGGEVAYLRSAFGSDLLASAVGVAIILAGTFSAAAVLRGGVGYLTGVVDVSQGGALIVIGLALCAVAVIGIVESLAFAAILTVIELAGLGLVVTAGLLAPEIASTPPEVAASSLSLGVLAAAALAFFAFIGFEDMVNLAEEVRQPEYTMPRAILVALGLVTAVYMLVAFAATRAVAPSALAASERPLALVWEAGFGVGGGFLAAIAVVAALNGVLAQIVMAARVLFGMGRRVPRLAWFHHVHPRFGTPVRGTVLVSAAVIVGALGLPVAELAELSATVLLGVFVTVNAALIRLKHKTPQAPFRVPVWVPWTGVVASLLALVFSLLPVV
jgi:amino acid transporter